jgi:hypothetical protein
MHKAEDEGNNTINLWFPKTNRTADELKALRGFKSSKIYNGGRAFPYDIDAEKDHLPDQYDLRLYGAVTPVKVILW